MKHEDRSAYNILIVIPARYSSTRLPGKPLIKIAGIAMIKRVAAIAQHVCKIFPNCEYTVATDDEKIVTFCIEEAIHVTMTSVSCNSGTERCWDVVKNSQSPPDFILNLQGDNPLCPPWFLVKMIEEWLADPTGQGQVFTPFVQLNWDELAAFYEAKKTTPYSGTTVLIDKAGFALAFSKLPIPSIRNKEKLMEVSNKSPVRRHIGLYGYTYYALSQYFILKPGQYEEPEGLEQMRFIENRVPVKMFEVNYNGRKGMNGIDSQEDITRAEDIIAEYGEFEL